ncbi:hypothetical protein KAJ89_02210 [Candidatus Parcubacteria bacterium]|nr:hypothetical protein [Candidatus Parcubacteria bacterium]
MKNTKRVAYVEFTRPDGSFAGAYPFGSKIDFSDKVGGLFYQPYADTPAHPQKLTSRIIYKTLCAGCSQEPDDCQCI